jgi:hypothetical protein
MAWQLIHAKEKNKKAILLMFVITGIMVGCNSIPKDEIDIRFEAMYGL